MTRKIAICTPVHRHTYPDFTASLLKTFRTASDTALDWLHIVGEPNIAQARNILVAEAMKRQVDDVVFIDSDIGWDPDAFWKLLQAPEDCRIVAAAPQRRDATAGQFCSIPDPVDPKTNEGLMSGLAATAFLRIDANLFEELQYARPYRHKNGTCKSWFFYDIAPFNAEGYAPEFIASDFYFSMKCKKEGHEVWIDPQIRVRHYNTVPLTARMVDHIRS